VRLLDGARRNRGRRPAFGAPPLGPMRANTTIVLESSCPMLTALTPPRVPVILFHFLFLLLFVLAPSLMAITTIPPLPGSTIVPPARVRRFSPPRTRTRVVPPCTTPRVVGLRTAPIRPLLSRGGVPFSVSGWLPPTLVVRRSPWILVSHVRPSVHVSVNCEQDQLYARTRDKGGGESRDRGGEGYRRKRTLAVVILEAGLLFFALCPLGHRLSHGS